MARLSLPASVYEAAVWTGAGADWTGALYVCAGALELPPPLAYVWLLPEAAETPLGASTTVTIFFVLITLRKIRLF